MADAEATVVVGEVHRAAHPILTPQHKGEDNRQPELIWPGAREARDGLRSQP
jgi:hypothetical protein